MTKFTNGPADGVVLSLRRAPLYLRVTKQRYGDKWDALDQLYDTPTIHEDLYAYRKVSDDGTVHLKVSKGRGGFFAMATYEFIEPQPDDRTMRVTEQWRWWCQAKAAKE